MRADGFWNRDEQAAGREHAERIDLECLWAIADVSGMIGMRSR
ncbi:MAG: hypothetical protein R2845_09385 [Thermomicrobiales bacterium]